MVLTARLVARPLLIVHEIYSPTFALCLQIMCYVCSSPFWDLPTVCSKYSKCAIAPCYLKNRRHANASYKNIELIGRRLSLWRCFRLLWRTSQQIVLQICRFQFKPISLLEKVTRTVSSLNLARGCNLGCQANPRLVITPKK